MILTTPLDVVVFKGHQMASQTLRTQPEPELSRVGLPQGPVEPEALAEVAEVAASLLDKNSEFLRDSCVDGSYL